MTGGVYDIPIQGYHNNKTHPHVVIIELDKDCWCIPAFGSEGVELAMTLDGFELAGYPRENCYVELNNEHAVQWADGRPGKLAKWLLARARKLTKGMFKHHVPCGQMSEQALCDLLNGWLTLDEKTGGDICSPHLRKKLKKKLTELQGSIDKP